MEARVAAADGCVKDHPHSERIHVDSTRSHHPLPQARRVRGAVIGVAAATAALSGPSIAAACSQDNATYFESFLDTTCLQTPLTNTSLDALGGLRLDTNGALTSKLWDTDGQFAAGDSLFPRIGVSTLATTGTGAAATLTLPTTPLPLTPDPANPVLGPTVGAVPDGDSVGGPSVIKPGPTSYVMYYTGSAEPGGPTVILRASSTDGKAWTRAATPNTAVLSPTPGSFDEKGVGAPDVRFDPADLTTPYRMWYSGRGTVFGGIGYATSTDGISWTKYTGTANASDPPAAVLDHGIGGSGDSFSTADPSVIKDGAVYKMWYTGDDSNRKRINYATSTDGIAWQKGGTVLGPESANVTANFSEGAYAPVVWKTGTTYNLLFSGRKFVSGTVYQTKIQSSTSSDGINWGSIGVGLNPAGSASNFDNSNLEAPTVFEEGVAGAERYKLYYAGNTLDANQNGHDRIGLATSSNGSSFGKFTGSQTGTSVLDIGAFGTTFDARGASGLAAAATSGTGANTYVGFFSGTRGSDFLPRLGEATSADGSAWAKVTGLSGVGGAIFDLGNGAAPDNKGALEPSVLLDGSTYDLYFTGISSTGTKSIVMSTSPQDGVTTKQPTNAWTARSQVLNGTSGTSPAIDASGGVSHPSVIKDGANYRMYYTGVSSSGTPRIGVVQSSSPTFSSPTAALLVMDAGGAGIEANGAKDPVVVKLGASDYRMLYTTIDADGIERLAHATSSDGSTWTQRGVIENPSHTGFAFDEIGVRPSGMLLDVAGTPLHVYFGGLSRTGRQQAGHATTPFPTATGQIPMGWATYQLGDGTVVRDFRTITRTSTGTGAELWLSFLQPYSGGTSFWSDYFPVTKLSVSEALNLLLTVKAVRWQARLSGPSGVPALDTVEIDHAPVQFFTSGSATTLNVAPPSTTALTAWGDLSIRTEAFAPTGGATVGGTVTIRNADTDAQLLGPLTLNTSGVTAQSLGAINAAQNRRLRLVLNLTSNGAGTPKVTSLTVGYTSVPVTSPFALFFATPASGAAPLAVTLDASASGVPSGRTITAYNWDFDGNGTVDQTTVTPTTTHAYLGGVWTAKLTITDSTGAVSAAASQTITATDVTAPINVAIAGPASLSKPFQVLKSLALTWRATDAESGIRNYALIYREAPVGGAFGAPVTYLTTIATRTLFTPKPGSTYCFRVRATNNVGLSTRSAERCTAQPLHSYALTAKGTWAKKSKTGHYLNRYRMAKVKGATLLRSGVTVKRLAIVATRGRGMGSVTIYLGTTKLKTIKLAATTTRKRQVISIANFTKVRKGTVKIVVATSGKPVIIEGLAVSKM
jgi:predicted GH43/DUF377 family glycosyl hydrolase